MSKNRTETRKIELVETDNLVRSFDRIWAARNNTSQLSIKRALYHAICLADGFYDKDRKAIREALELP